MGKRSDGVLEIARHRTCVNGAGVEEVRHQQCDRRARWRLVRGCRSMYGWACHATQGPALSPDRDAWDCDGVLTPHVIEIGDTYYMIYAGKKGNEWQTGLAKTAKR